MRELVLARIDDRLIHGQIATQWIAATHTNSILIIDDALAKNAMMVRMLTAIVPTGITVHVKPLSEAVEYLKTDTDKKENLMILVKVPEVFEALIDDGIEIQKIILGGMGLAAGRKKLNRNVAASSSEKECMKRIIEKGVPIYYQLVPSDKAANIKNLL